MANIQDFGEKIGGARKDLWKSRGLISEDLTDMTEYERSTLVRKENIWLKPDWIKLVSEGTPQCVAFWQSKMRQALPPKPQSADQETQSNYVQVISALRDAVMAVKEPGQIDSFYEDYLCSTYLRSGNSYHRYVAPEAQGIINNKFLDMSRSNQHRMQRQAQKALFGIPKNQQAYVSAKNRLSVYQFDGEKVTVGPDKYLPTITALTIDTGLGRIYRTLRKGTAFADQEEWQKGSYFVFDDNASKPLAINFQTEKDARDYIEDYAQQLQKEENELSADLASNKTSKRKKPFVPPQLQHLKRSGPDYRDHFHARSRYFLHDLKFRGGEFGNWLNQHDREANLDFAYDAFRDLARVLQIRPEDVSLNGSLAIAFGARGRGGRSSGAAHYEPERQVINLTKMSGAGCLAHEWGHALDHAIGIAEGFTGLASEQKTYKLPPYMKDLLRAMKHKTVLVPPQVLACERAPEIERCKKSIRDWIDGEKPANMPLDLEQKWERTVNTILSSADSFHGSEYMSYAPPDKKTKPEIELLSQIRKSVTRRGLTKNTKQQIVLWSMELKKHEEIAKATEPMERSVETDFYQGSKAFDSQFSRMGHGYWSSDCEMFARAFDCYIADKLKETGDRSDYLSAYANSYTRVDADGKTVAAIPMGDERKILNDHFDTLLSALKERGLLTEFIEARSLPVKEQPATDRPRASAIPNRSGPAQGRRVRYEQMTFEDMLFSAESRKQTPSHDDGPPYGHTR